MAEDDPFEAAAHCPNCRAEYRAGFETCADCGSALVRGPAPPEEEPGHPDAWQEATARAWAPARGASEEHPEPVELCRLPFDQAHMLAGRLRQEGFEVDVTDSVYPGGGYLVNDPEVGWSHIWVHRARLEEARRIAKSVLAGDEAI